MNQRHRNVQNTYLLVTTYSCYSQMAAETNANAPVVAASAGAPGQGSDWNKQMWHWEERNANTFAVDTIKKLFGQAVVAAGEYTVRIVDVSKCTGESSVNLRKGKKTYLYDLQAKVKWQGTTHHNCEFRFSVFND